MGGEQNRLLQRSFHAALEEAKGVCSRVPGAKTTIPV